MKIQNVLPTLLAILLGLGANRLYSQDVGNYLIQKSADYDQTSTAAPSLDAEQPYQCFCYVSTGTTSALLTSSSLTTPTSSQFQLNSSGNLSFEESFNSKSALDSAFGNGSYTLDIWTTTPNQYITNLVVSSDDYPPIPQITSVTNAAWSGGKLVITDLTMPVTLSWSGFSGGSAYLQINNTNINTQVSGTSYIIPANTFTSGTYSRASLQFSNNSVAGSNPNPIPNASGGVSYQNQVEFIIQAGTPVVSKNQFTVEKQHGLTQTSNSAPSEILGFFGNGDPAPYSFDIQSPTAGTASGPNSTSYPLVFTGNNNSSNGGTYGVLSGSFSSQASLDSTYLDGSYTFPDSQVVSLTGDIYPGVPQVTLVNGSTPVWEANRLILDPTIDNTLTWSTFNTMSNPNWLESVKFDSDNSGSVSLSQKAGLTSSSSSVFTTYKILANTLTMGSTYTGELNFGLPVTALVSGNTLHASNYSTTTYFSILAEPATYNGIVQVNAPPGTAWVTSPWLGVVNISSSLSPYYYTNYLGFIAPLTTDYRGVWFYDSLLSDYIWTSNTNYPYFYGNRNGKWYYLYTASPPSSPSYASIYEFGGRGWIFANQY